MSWLLMNTPTTWCKSSLHYATQCKEPSSSIHYQAICRWLWKTSRARIHYRPWLPCWHTRKSIVLLCNPSKRLFMSYPCMPMVLTSYRRLSTFFLSSIPYLSSTLQGKTFWRFRSTRMQCVCSSKWWEKWKIYKTLAARVSTKQICKTSRSDS